MLVEPETQDGLTLVDELADIEESYVSMESMIRELDTIASRISVEGVSRSDAAALTAYDSGIFSARYPVNSFTLSPSMTNVRPALEGIVNKTFEIVQQILDAIAEFIDRAIKWVSEFFSKTNLKKEIKSFTQDLVKGHDERITALEKALADLRKNKELTPAEKVQVTQELTDIDSGVDPQLKVLRENAAASYSILAKSCTDRPENVVKLMGYYTDIPNLGLAMEYIVNALDDSLDRFIKNPVIENLSMATTTAISLEEGFTNTLRSIAAKLGRVKLDNISFGLQDAKEPDTYLTQVRQALHQAAQTPCGRVLSDDVGHDWKVVDRNRNIIGDAVGKVVEELDKNLEIYSRLNASVKRLRKQMSKIKRVGNPNVEQEIEARNTLIQVNRTLRRSVLAYMRLREIPFLVFNALRRNSVAEIEYTRAVSAKLKQAK